MSIQSAKMIFLTRLWINSQNLQLSTSFSPDNDDLIEVLYDFDKSLKYVTMTFKMDLIPGYAEDSNNNVPNAFSVLMKSASVNSKAPTLIEKEKPRFNGKAQTIEILGKRGYFCPAIIHIVFLSFYSVVRKFYFHHLISIQCKFTQKRFDRKFQSLYYYQRIKVHKIEVHIYTCFVLRARPRH